MGRRNLKQLEQAVRDARTVRRKALAFYRLAVFHDNNGRETIAVPLYRRAIALGLDGRSEVRAFAWLASSLYKTGRPTAAMRCVRRALAAHCSPEIRRFLVKLQARLSTEVE